MTKAAGIDIEEDLYDHFQKNMVPVIINHQASKVRGPSVCIPHLKSLDVVGMEIVQCCEGLDIYQVYMHALLTIHEISLLIFIQVWKFLRSDVLHNKLKVLAIRPEEIPSLTTASIQYISSMTGDTNVGVRSDRKLFLDSCEPCDKVLTKQQSKQ